MKKLIALLLCLIMVVSVFAGCGKKDKKTTDSANTLTIGLPKSSLVVDYYSNHYTKWLEKKMQEKGYADFKLEFQPFNAAQADYQSQLSTMVAGKQDLPDILCGFNLGAEAYEDYGNAGTFVNLAGYFNDKEGKAKIWWDQFTKLDADTQANIWRRMQTEIEGSDSRIYAFPEIQQSLIDIMDYQVWINQAWLDNLGLAMPTNIEEFRHVLEEFKNKDANGNGDASDEIPLLGTKDQLSGQTLHWLINMFLYEDRNIMFNVDDNGKLYSPYREDKYREALSFIRSLIKDGLMSPLTLNAKSSDLHQAVTPADGAQTAGVVCGHITLCFVQDDPGLLNYQPLPLWGNAIYHEDTNNYTTFVTRSCYERGKMDMAWDLLMFMSTNESAIIQRYGAERTEENPDGSWNWVEDENAKSVMGTKAVIRLYKDTWSTRGNDNWRNVEATILFNAEGEGNLEVDANSEGEVRQHKYKLFNEAIKNYTTQIENHNPDDKYICPLLVWTDKEKVEGGDARDACKNVISQWRTNFLRGDKDIDNDAHWQEYLSQLDKQGYDKWLFYAQQVYDRTMSEKG